MSNFGLGVLLGIMGGNKDSAKAMTGAIGKEIAALNLDEERLLITLTDGKAITLSDEGQSCCEDRYLRSDDDLDAFIGATLLSAEVREAPGIKQGRGEEQEGAHEVAFLIISTSLGDFTVETHNEHNGYYGGFLIRAMDVSEAQYKEKQK